jgi:hypothetical protein
MSSTEQLQMPVKLSCRYGEMTCHNQHTLKAAIFSAFPDAVDTVHFRLQFNTAHGERVLDFTCHEDGQMHETYGSRATLDFGLLLSRIHWDSK